MARKSIGLFGDSGSSEVSAVHAWVMSSFPLLFTRILDTHGTAH